jgi:DNA-binding NarL/FixJ family response regulator
MRTARDEKVPAELLRRESATRNGAHRPLRIWLVDDDEVFRELMARQLDKGHALQCERQFASGELLLSALSREAQPQAIVVDVHLRDRNGIDFIQPIKALATATRVLMLATFFDPAQAARALKEGASAFLLKSSSLDEIREQIIDSTRADFPHPRLYLRANGHGRASNRQSLPRNGRIRGADGRH